MTRTFTMNFGTAVTGARYKLVSALGVLGSAVVPGNEIVAGKFIEIATEVGTAVAAYWYCDTAGLDDLQPFADSMTADLAALALDVAAIKAKTDSLAFTVAGLVDSNIQAVNDATVGGTGAAGNEWGPA